MHLKSVLSLLFAGSLIAQPVEDTARNAMNRGVAAFKSARYADAVNEFERAAKLDPASVMPRLYLATTLMTQWIPGADSPENETFAARAEAEFHKVLDIDPRERTAIASLASLAFNKGKATPAESRQPERLRHLDEAETWYRKLTEVDANDKTAF